MTIFINTGTILAQGNNFQLFINEHFSQLKSAGDNYNLLILMDSKRLKSFP